MPRDKQTTAKSVMEAEMKEAENEMAELERRLEEEAREKTKHNGSTSECSSKENSLTDSQPLTQELRVLYSTKAGGSSKPSEPPPQTQSAPETPDPLRLESAPTSPELMEVAVENPSGVERTSKKKRKKTSSIIPVTLSLPPPSSQNIGTQQL